MGTLSTALPNRPPRVLRTPVALYTDMKEPGLSQTGHLHVSVLLWRSPRTGRAHLLHSQHNYGRLQGR